MHPKELASFSIVFGIGFTSEAIIIGFPNLSIYFTISLFLASLLLVKSIMLPFVSSIAIPTVIPESIPTIRFRLAPQLILRSENLSYPCCELSSNTLYLL